MAPDREAPTPFPIAIVSFGYKDKNSKDVQKFLESMGCYDDVVDCRDFLQRDPSVSVGHNVNGSNEGTQRAVFGQDGFCDLMECLLTKAGSSSCNGIVTPVCNHGCHRSDTAGRMTTDILNQVTNDVGDRIYNARYFAFHDVWKWEGVKQQLDDVKRWIAEPWTLTPGGPKPREQRYGYEAAMGNSKAAQQWGDVQQWFEQHFWSVPKAVQADDVVHDEPRAKRARSDDVPREGGRPDQPQWAAAAAAAANIIAGGEFPPQPPPQVPMPPPGPPPSHIQPAYVTFGCDPHVWNDLMMEMGVDGTARAELFLLAQHSQRGYEACNSIIGKLLKKKADQEFVGNPSGFVHRAVCNARGTLQAW
jgi:hypothetical protein